MDPVLDWLKRSRDLGFLGPGPIEDHVRHALGFAEVAGEAPDQVVDLGSGGGVPGLVLAAYWPTVEIVLLDSNERRTAFLTEAVAGLGWQERVAVVRLRAEVAGRDDRWRGAYGLVVARSFASPPVTAECAAPLLRVGGRLIVSEPPDAGSRWPATGVAKVGMVAEPVQAAGGARYATLVQAEPCPQAFPRREGVPAKRPLW